MQKVKKGAKKKKDELPCLPKAFFLSKWKKGQDLTQTCLIALIHGERKSP